MGILSWIVVGLIAGGLANLIYPGDSKGGWVGALVLGVVGGAVGGFLFGAITGEDVMTGFNIMSIAVATAGGLLLVFAYNALTGSRNRTTV